MTPQPEAGAGQANPTLRRGNDGEGVVRLHTQLRHVGLPVQGDTLDHFGAATEETVRAFQRRRRLQVDGICGPDTWSALHEDPLGLGDRLLSLRRPMLRGDDVGQLQQQLSAIGFDAGRIDGIFGPRTDTALRDFQRNAAVAVDGICGRDTIAAMQRVGGLADGEISELRERESFAASPRDCPAVECCWPAACPEQVRPSPSSQPISNRPGRAVRRPSTSGSTPTRRATRTSSTSTSVCSSSRWPTPPGTAPITAVVATDRSAGTP